MRTQGMRVALVMGFAVLQAGCGDAVLGRSERPTIYGADDRRNYHLLTDPGQIALADATALLLDATDVTWNGSGYDLSTIPFWQDATLCEDEPFYDEPVAGWCSGFLVSADRLATAGHCILDQADCEATSYVFGFQTDSSGQVVTSVPAQNVYGCARLIARRAKSTNSTPDFAVVQLDRPVTGSVPRIPRVVRLKGKVADGASMLISGHPWGLSTKVAGGATVKDNSQAMYYQSNLDAFGGNSGSGVMDPQSGIVEGILIDGNADWEWDSSLQCNRSYTCPDSGCGGTWEIVARSTLVSPFVPGQAGCTETAGIVSSTKTHDLGPQPAGMEIVVGLEWATSSNLDAYLDRRSGSKWSTVQSSASGEPGEFLRYTVPPTQANQPFRVRVRLKSGSASAYTLRTCL